METFSAEYEMVGTTSSGQPKNDTFIFEGETTDGIITKLNFDIIRNKGSEDEYSKKDIMGYLMNISDATVEKTEDGYRLATLSAYGYDPAYSDGDTYYAQYMLTASCENLTEDTVFADLSFSDLAQHGNVVTVEKACIAYGYLAREAGLELTAETLVKDLLTLHGLYADGAFVEGSNRVSFAGYNGGRSYGEQLEAITDYILANQMTLEDVYEMFRTVNQASTQIQDRDAIAVRDAQETDGVGGVLTADGSDYINALIAGQDDLDGVDGVSGATMTSNALKQAVRYAQEAIVR